MDARERHDLVGEQGPDFVAGRVDEVLEPRCPSCGRRLGDDGACIVHGTPCAHMHTSRRREPPSSAPAAWPAVLIEECADCGEIVSSRLVERP